MFMFNIVDYRFIREKASLRISFSTLYHIKYLMRMKGKFFSDIYNSLKGYQFTSYDT